MTDLGNDTTKNVEKSLKKGEVIDFSVSIFTIRSDRDKT